MRFQHKNIAPVRAWLEGHAPMIHQLEWEKEIVTGGYAFLPSTLKRRAAEPARPASIAEIVGFAKVGGPRQVTATLRFYFHINMSAVADPLPLVEAVGFVEAEGGYEEFLLAGHPDGGLISVSRERLPFQDGLQPITWWGP
jgi:hypothetical protein